MYYKNDQISNVEYFSKFGTLKMYNKTKPAL
jgi:hypothetical protein